MNKADNGLLPCPFCGCSMINDWQLEDEYRAGKYYVACDFCHAQTSLFVDEHAAINAWNSRAATGKTVDPATPESTATWEGVDADEFLNELRVA